MPNDYSDIVNLPRPTSNHPKMPRSQRAKQFAPFAALGNLKQSYHPPRKINNSRQIVDLLNIDNF